MPDLVVGWRRFRESVLPDPYPFPSACLPLLQGGKQAQPAGFSRRNDLRHRHGCKMPDLVVFFHLVLLFILFMR